MKAVPKILPIQPCFEFMPELIQMKDLFFVHIVLADSKPNFTWRLMPRDTPKIQINSYA